MKSWTYKIITRIFLSCDGSIKAEDGGRLQVWMTSLSGQSFTAFHKQVYYLMNSPAGCVAMDRSEEIFEDM